MSNLKLHAKALELLAEYYESEQFDPVLDETNILLSNNSVLQELRQIRTHLTSYHDLEEYENLVAGISSFIRCIMNDDKNFRALMWDRALGAI